MNTGGRGTQRTSVVERVLRLAGCMGDDQRLVSMRWVMIKVGVAVLGDCQSWCGRAGWREIRSGLAGK